jgi:hypothetical protein
MTADKPDTLKDVDEYLAEQRARLSKLDKEIIEAIEELKAIKRKRWSID